MNLFFQTLLTQIENERTMHQTAVELAVCGHIIIDDNIHKQAVSRNGVFGTCKKIKTFLKTIYVSTYFFSIE